MKKRGFYDLVDIMKVLRKECMWDKEQTHKSIRRNFLEETYEAVEAIDNDDINLLKEELGDVMLQVVFHTEIESELENFDIDDVCEGICSKLVLRHPHIFSDVKVENSAEILENWDKIKKIEKNQKSTYEVLDSVAKSLPSLIRGDKIYSKLLKEENYKPEPVLYEPSQDIEKDLCNKLFDMVKVAKDNKIDLEESFSKYIDDYIKTFK